MNTSAVLVNTYNHREYIQSCIESVILQSIKPDEIIVYDDGSTDDTARILRQLESTHQVRVIYGKRSSRPSHIAQAHAVTEAFRASSAQIIFLLDGDDLFHRQKVESYLPHFRNTTVMVQAPMIKIDATGHEIGIEHYASRHITDHRSYIARTRDLDFYYPTSAQAYSRDYLNRVLPIDFSDGYRSWIDSRLPTIAPFFGQITTLDTPLTYWRRHAASDSVKLKSRWHLAKQTRARTAAYNAYCRAHGHPPVSLWRCRRYWRQIARAIMPGFFARFSQLRRRRNTN